VARIAQDLQTALGDFFGDQDSSHNSPMLVGSTGKPRMFSMFMGELFVKDRPVSPPSPF
jgi:hypothetical protein